MKKLNVGIIGAGRIGQVHAKSIIYHIPQAKIVAISDIYYEGAKRVGTLIFIILICIIFVIMIRFGIGVLLIYGCLSALLNNADNRKAVHRL